MMNATQERMSLLSLSLKNRELWLVVIESAAFCSVVFIAFLGNIWLCLAFYKTRTLRSPQNYYLASLALTDILNAVVCSIALAALIKGEWPYGDFICQCQGLVMSTCASVSLLTLGMIAINRYTKICRSRSLYQKIYSKRNVLISIATSWIATVFVAAGAFFAGKTVYYFHPGKSWCFYQLDLKENMGLYVMFCFSIIISFAFSTIVFSYYKVLRKIRAHFVQVGNASLRDDNSKAFAEEVKVTMMIFTTILAFSICWTPSFTIDFYEILGGYYTLPRQVYMLNIFTYISSSAINPMIYGLMKRDFKEAYKKVLNCLPRVTKIKVQEKP